MIGVAPVFLILSNSDFSRSAFIRVESRFCVNSAIFLSMSSRRCRAADTASLVIRNFPMPGGAFGVSMGNPSKATEAIRCKQRRKPFHQIFRPRRCESEDVGIRRSIARLSFVATPMVLETIVLSAVDLNVVKFARESNGGGEQLRCLV